MASTLCRKIQAILRFFDLFSYSSFIRYKGQSQFKSATGGFFSIIVLIIFAVLFTNIGLKTLQREIISSSFNVDNSPEPTSTTVRLDPKSFMFALGILRINLNDPRIRIFDVEMSSTTVSSGFQFVSSEPIQLQACTQVHFAMTQNLKKTVKQNPENVNWLCPKINTFFSLRIIINTFFKGNFNSAQLYWQIFGKFSSNRMKFLNIQVKKCNPASDISRPCMNDSEIQAIQNYYGPFFVGLFFSNPLINPGDSNYLDFYFEDSNYMAFSTELGVQSNIYIQDYQIVTDQSIMPYKSQKSQTGIIISEAFKNSNYVAKSGLYLNMLIFKSSSSTTYSRSFYKIDEFFSYIGGLVGVILSGMFLLASYNEFNFYHDLAKSLFNIERLIPTPNLWTFIKQNLFEFFRKCITPGKYESIQKSLLLKQEIEMQLDLRLILQRLIFVQRSVQRLFEKGQYEMMQLSKRYTVKQSKKMRLRKHLENYLNRLLNQTKNPSLVSLNQAESGIMTNNFLEPSRKITEYYTESQSEDDEQIDSERQNEVKRSIHQFRKSYEEGNPYSRKIASEVDESVLKLILSMENSTTVEKTLNRGLQSKPYSLQQYSSAGKVYPEKSFQEQTLSKNKIKQFQFIEP